MRARGIALTGLVGALCAAGPAVPAVQAQVGPIVVRPAKDHPGCQIYLKSDGSRLMFKGQPIAAGGRCPGEFLRGTVTRFGANSYRLLLPGQDCVINPQGEGRCR